LELDLTVPRTLTQEYGKVDLSIYVSGQRLRPEILSHAGDYRITRAIAARDLFWKVVPVAVVFKRAGLFAGSLSTDHLALFKEITLWAQ
jgi:hypothetical protein